MDKPDLAALRRPYDGVRLDESGLAADPFEQFGRWFSDAVEAGIPEPNAMVLATAGADSTPSARTVLLKGYGPDGFRFFTNNRSRKGRALAANPQACLLFPWHALHRQVIVEGIAVPLPKRVAQRYFRSRPRGAQLGAWASEWQSSPVTRAELEDRYRELEARWPGAVPMPGFWGGHRVVPSTVEFWQGRANRMHDRLRFRRRGDPGLGDSTGSGGPTGDGGATWEVERLSP